MWMKALAVFLCAGSFVCSAPLTAEELKSGPQVGARLPGPFLTITVVHAEKPDLPGKKSDYVEEYGQSPVVLIIARIDDVAPESGCRGCPVQDGQEERPRPVGHAIGR